MPKKRVSQLCLAVVAGWVLLIAGCGPSMVAVEGTVTWDGTPVETGTISFLPADGEGPSFGGELKNGSYRVEVAEPAALGAKNVTITGVRKTGKMIEAGPPRPRERWSKSC